MERPQRLVFGTAAEAYEAHRPGYPDALFDELIGLVGSDARALDAGSGTGKVAVGLAARGVVGTAIEPDADMATVARRRLEGTGWEVLVDDLETCDLDAGAYDLFTCGQAWHWVDAERGLAQVRRALRPGGVAAIFWNRPEFPDTALRADLDAVYARLEPDLESSLAAKAHGPKGLPPPVAPPPEGFADARAEVHRHVVHHTTRSWIGLLGTHSDHLRLEDGRRTALHGAVADAIDAHGGELDVVYRCEVWLARRTS